jgi:hypothetical protein
MAKDAITYSDLTLYGGNFDVYLEEQRRLGTYYLEAHGVVHTGHCALNFSSSSPKAGLGLLKGLLNLLVFRKSAKVPALAVVSETSSPVPDLDQFTAQQKQYLKFFRWLYQLGRVES